MEELSVLYKHHEDWVKIALSFGCKYLSEDVVHDVYVRIVDAGYLDKIVVNGEPNVALIWIMIRNRSFQVIKGESKYFSPYDDLKNVANDYDSKEEKGALELIYLQIEKEIGTWHWYDSMLFNVYKEGNLSMRKIAKDSGISLTSIFNTLKVCKKRIKDRIGEDYQDYINRDFDLI
jgi:hypothetical protein